MKLKMVLRATDGVRETPIKFVEDVLLWAAKKDRAIFTFDDECQISMKNQEDRDGRR
jgi:hypothetical protein